MLSIKKPQTKNPEIPESRRRSEENNYSRLSSSLFWSKFCTEAILESTLRNEVWSEIQFFRSFSKIEMRQFSPDLWLKGKDLEDQLR